MSKPVITVENLSKAYRIGLKEEVPDTLMSAMTALVKAPWRKFHELRKLDTFRHSGESEDIYWALKDVSFEVQEGEVLGVIGRNGAGKSTLLKILSRITEPTSGRAIIRGRVSSLLEVGTGFHPELSGRENVYLNGTILGMTKSEIDRKFDEIVDFSGIEKFLDTPIKRYSSGMKVRLAFAVAAHLEPEILIIDEVLAVGDAEFQKKCMGKMQDVAKGGRTVLFVSHNMPAIRSLTNRCVFLKSGKLMGVYETDEAIDEYLGDCLLEAQASTGSLDYFRRDRGAEREVQFRKIGVAPSTTCGEILPRLSPCETILIEIEVEADRQIFGACVSLTLVKNQETVVTTVFSPDAGCSFELKKGINRLQCTLPTMSLSPGRYFVNVGINRNANSLAYDVIQDYPIFDVVLDELDDGTIDWPHRPWGAVHLPDTKWCRV